MKNWKKSPQNIKAIIIIVFLVLVVPFIFVNGGLWFGNWLNKITLININVPGLGNSEWLSFWGSYFGGVATFLAVWWTVTQTEKHFKQTTLEQKKQNHRYLDEQEKQRKLDVLPLLLLQPIETRQTSYATIFLGELENKKVESITVDDLKPIYEEIELSQITVVFGSQFLIRPGGLTNEEMRLVKNKGYEELKKDGKNSLTFPNSTYLYPHWLINTGRETAVNLRMAIVSKNDLEICHLNSVFSLMIKSRVKINFLINISNNDVDKIINEYKLQIIYNDIFSNQYKQFFPISIFSEKYGLGFSIEIDIKQILL